MARSGRFRSSGDGPLTPRDRCSLVSLPKKRAKLPKQEVFRFQVQQACGDPVGVAPFRGRPIERITGERVDNAHAAGTALPCAQSRSSWTRSAMVRDRGTAVSSPVRMISESRSRSADQAEVQPVGCASEELSKPFFLEGINHDQGVSRSDQQLDLPGRVILPRSSHQHSQYPPIRHIHGRYTIRQIRPPESSATYRDPSGPTASPEGR